MGIDISKITKLFEEISCRSNCCHEAMMCEFDNKDSTPAHSRDGTPSHHMRQLSRSSSGSANDHISSIPHTDIVL